MHLLIIVCIVSEVFADFVNLRGYNYDGNANEKPYAIYPTTKLPALRTEFLTYTAPESFHDVPRSEVDLLADVLVPQRIVFIRGPETNVFTQTAEQLAKRNSLNIYVLNRQTDQATLLSQYEEIQQQHRHKPSVQFVKYRTMADLQLAQKTIRRKYDLLPGASTTYNEPEVAPVIDLRSLAIGTKEANFNSYRSSGEPVLDLHSLAIATENEDLIANSNSIRATHAPVIFKLATRGSTSYETYPNDAESTAAY